MFMQQSSYTIVHVKGEDNVVADSLCHDYLHDDESERALAHEADMVAEVDMEVDVDQEQLKRIPAGPD
jgi:hypothetical protein